MCGFFVRDKFDRFYEKISQDNRSTDKALIFDEYFVYEDLNSPLSDISCYSLHIRIYRLCAFVFVMKEFQFLLLVELKWG